MTTAKPRVLFVDDEPDLLASLKLALRKSYRVETAGSGAEGLARIESAEPFAVIVSDMRMPEMNGARFLAAARAAAPDATRILLTGETDQTSAIEAVNKGAIFRFLKKPCDAPDLREALDAAVEHHRLVTAERDLLQNTLHASVQLLTDILGHVHPQAFSRSARVHMIVRHLCEQLSLPEGWSFELAGMLANIGLVTIPAETVEKDCAGEALEDWEQDLIERHPEIGREMIASIPRLEVVARMVARQGRAASHEDVTGEPAEWDPEILGGELLRMASAFERLASAGENTPAIAYERLRKFSPPFPRSLVSYLEGYELGLDGMAVATLMLDQLAPGMVTQAEVRSKSGGMLAAKGQAVTTTFIERLRNFDRGAGVEQPIRVLTPRRLLSSNQSA